MIAGSVDGYSVPVSALLIRYRETIDGKNLYCDRGTAVQHST